MSDFTHPAFAAFRAAYTELGDLRGAIALLQWDEQTYLPSRGAEARGRQIAALAAILHAKQTSPEFDRLLEPLLADPDALSPDEQAAVREFTFDRDRARKLPPALVREMALEGSRGFNTWQTARRENNFSAFAPCLKRLLDLSRQKADCFGWDESPWDALVQDFERGMTATRVEAAFRPLREATVALLDRIRGAARPDVAFLQQTWDVARQRELGMRVAADLGFDFEAGRQDVSSHPFTTDIARGDTRFTTRFTETSLLDALGSTIHETGHALYEQGFLATDDGTPLSGAPSYGVHESQSRFWEIYVGQSLPFWKHYTPIVRQYFPGRIAGADADRFYRAVNKVEPGLIRVESDEVTYNLHIVIRFELERLLLEGRLAVEDLPAEWNRRYREYLGVDVPSDALGCLQDVHWSGGAFGYFPSYTFGNMYAAMLVEKMERDLPALWDAVGRGDFALPLGWLRAHIHEPGRRYLPLDLIERAAGAPFGADPLIRHLSRKYTALYNL